MPESLNHRRFQDPFPSLQANATKPSEKLRSLAKQVCHKVVYDSWNVLCTQESSVVLENATGTKGDLNVKTRVSSQKYAWLVNERHHKRCHGAHFGINISSTIPQPKAPYHNIGITSGKASNRHLKLRLRFYPPADICVCVCVVCAYNLGRTTFGKKCLVYINYCLQF